MLQQPEKSIHCHPCSCLIRSPPSGGWAVSDIGPSGMGQELVSEDTPLDTLPFPLCLSTRKQQLASEGAPLTA